MALRIEKARGVGFCFGVRRAINLLEKAAQERGGVETLGEVVHNQQVLQRLEQMGVRVARDLADLRGSVVAISSHGAGPEVLLALKGKYAIVLDTTCPFVHRAQVAARRLAESGFFVVIYGDAGHSEVRGILAWANGKGLATMDVKDVAALEPVPRRMGILSQTTQIPDHFIGFAKELIGTAFGKDSEVRIIDTICHDIRDRQTAALELAAKVDMMLVVGGQQSANTARLAEMCAAVTRCHQIETAGDIKRSWLKGKSRVGITAGASTPEEVIEEVVARLEAMGG